MRNRFVVVTVFVSAVLPVVAYEPANAACFSSPSFNAVYAVTDEPEAKRIRELIPSEFSFRGRLGRVDRVIVVPGVTETIRVAADPVCNSRPLVAAKGSLADNVAAVVVSRDAKGKLLSASVYRNDCAAWLTAMSGDRGAFACASKALKADQTTSKGHPMIELPLDDSMKKGLTRLSVIVVGSVHADKLDKAITAIRDDGDTCVRLAASREKFEDEFDGFICVDTIYRDHGLDARCTSDKVGAWAVGVKDVDYTDCEIIGLGAINDFGKNCTKNKTSDDPKCEADPGQIEVYATTCGALAVPFNYASIRPSGKWRYLSGITPVSREASHDSGPIVLPGQEFGDEFLGSMLTGGKSTNHRKTDIGTDDSEGRGVMHITGSVEEDDSAVLVYPRIPVSVVCKDGDDDPTNNEACQCFYPEADETVVGCVVEREQGKKEKCKKLSEAPDSCVVLGTQYIGYFACEAETNGYPYDGLPCTRPEHCGEGGRCSAKTVCVAENTVWKEGWTPPHGAEPCRLDTTGTKTCGDGRQCGLSLFDFTGRSAIAYDLPNTGQGTQAGVCADTGASCTADNGCTPGVSCIGYTLSAGKVKDK